MSSKDNKLTIEWLRRGLEHIRDGQHRCDAASLARQVLDGHVWDSRWMEKEQKELELKKPWKR
jgi:hypothetical protein